MSGPRCSAALLLPTSVLWLDKVPSAEIDMTLVGWVTAALVLFHRAQERRLIRGLGSRALVRGGWER